MFVLPTFNLGVVGTVPRIEGVYNIEDRDTEANILASSPTNPSGEVTVKFGTDTYDLYIWDGSAWYTYNNDS